MKLCVPKFLYDKNSFGSIFKQNDTISNSTDKTHADADNAVFHLLPLFNMPDVVLNVCLYTNVQIYREKGKVYD